MIKKETMYSEDVVVPQNIMYNNISYDVISIGEAFRGCSELTAITIPETVYSLADNCFNKCFKLVNIEFNNCLEAIPFGAFEECTSLSKTNFPETVKYIQGNAFKGCSLLQEFKCPDSLLSIGKSAFEKCTSLKEITLNSNILIIPEYCFSGCVSLNSIPHLDSVIRMETGSFESCSGLNEISLPNIISISDKAFKNCSGLVSISLGNSLEKIGSEILSNCSSLESLIVPENVETFGSSILSGCYSLKELSFKDSDIPLSFPSGSYDGETNIQKIEIDGKTIQFKIQYYNAFFNGLPIEKLYIGRSLSYSSRYTISGDGGVDYYLITCYDAPFNNLPKLKDLVIGDNVSLLGPEEEYISEVEMYVTPGSFKKCSNLENITVENITPPCGAEFPSYVYTNARLNIPENTKTLYQEAEGWKEFKNIFDGTEPVLVEEINLNVNELSLEIGDTYQLTAEVLPEDATDLTIFWESSNQDCVSVDENGLLTALSEGTATVTARSADGNCETSCLVTVTSVDDSVDTIGSCVGGVYTVYNLQSIKILESDDSDKVKHLPNGVYIVNGKKLIIK